MALQRDGQLVIVDLSDVGRVLIFGDIHGDYESLQHGLAELRSDDLALFLGDYADRGPDGVEVIETIDRLMQDNPGRVVALMGNHEDYDEHGNPMFRPCTLIQEAERKRGSWSEFFPRFRAFTGKLALSALIPGYALCVHAGVGSSLAAVSDLVSPSGTLRTELLWNDAVATPGERPSMRGIGNTFGPDVTSRVCSALDVNVIYRSHEPRKAQDGPFLEHDGRVVTTNSTNAYGGAPFVVALDTSELPLGDRAVRQATLFL